MSTREGKSGPRTLDLRGAPATLLDPVTMHMLHQPTVIPRETLAQIADDIAPGEAKRRQYTFWFVGAGYVFIVLANIGYFRFVSKGSPWTVVNAGFWLVQAISMFGAPLLVTVMARAERRARVIPVMLAHCRCPQCGYSLQGLPSDSADGATVCPECGAAWDMTMAATKRAAADRPKPARAVLALVVVAGVIVLWAVLG